MMGGDEVFQPAHLEQALGEAIGATHETQQVWVGPVQRFGSLFGRHLQEVFKQPASSDQRKLQSIFSQFCLQSLQKS